MANEITTTTFDDLTYTAAVQPVVIAALAERTRHIRLAQHAHHT